LCFLELAGKHLDVSRRNIGGRSISHAAIDVCEFDGGTVVFCRLLEITTQARDTSPVH
jgi:hypothetical protein